MTHFDITAKNRVARVPERGQYDQETIYRLIDEALICHVGLVENNEPVVIPTLHTRRENHILLHGSTKSRLIKYVQAGQPLCLTITHVDGLVLARSVFHHSVNYRSVVLFGRGTLVPDEEKLAYLEEFTNNVLPGRWEEVRPPNTTEFKATAIVTIPIELASAKIRVGPPKDEAEDMSRPVWAGVLPIRQQILAPEPDPNLNPDIEIPPYVLDYVKSRNG